MTFIQKDYAPEETHPHDGNLVRVARGSFGASTSLPHANSWLGCEKWPTGYSTLRVERDLQKRPICVEKDPQKRPTCVKRVRCASYCFTVQHMCQKRPTKRCVVARSGLRVTASYCSTVQHMCQKRPTKETYTCEKRPTKETNMCEKSVLLHEVAYELWYCIALRYHKRVKKDPQKGLVCVK